MPGYRPTRIRRLLALDRSDHRLLVRSDRQHCDEDFGYGYYPFSVLAHRWVCTDNWSFLIDDAGIYGV